MAISERDSHTGHMTTGHEWNGIKELNTPVPRIVWLTLLATFLFAAIYWVLMPAWPLGSSHTRGLLGQDQRQMVAQQIDTAAQDRSAWMRKVSALSYDRIRDDFALMKMVREDGYRLFGDNCAACHGVEATGGNGFPNLIDKDWLWGKDPDAIAHLIAVGVNSPANEETRVSQMPAFGRDGILDNDSVLSVTDYIRSLSDRTIAKGAGASSVAAGQIVFAANCAACHGPDARGNTAIGVPNLADRTWIYGGDLQSVYTSIAQGRQGEMPAWQDRLNETERKILTVYLLDKGAAW